MMNLLEKLADKQPGADPLDFAPALLRIKEKPAAPLAGWMLRLLFALAAGVFIWAVFGRLDIVAVADGKLVPVSYLKIVQPAEQGIIKEILVQEGQLVREGQVLIRMDSVMTQADVKTIETKYHNKRLALKTQSLTADGETYALAPGMQVAAEINLGTRTVLEYVLSPVQKAFHEAARER